MEQVRLGDGGPEVSAVGLGAMGMSEFYGPGDDEQSVATIGRALDLGVTLIDTADFYGIGHNERLIGRSISGRREEAVLSVKFGATRTPDGGFGPVDASPDHIREAVEGSLRRLGVEHIDVYYPARVDPNVPVEETIGAMSELVASGKVGHIGLSEVSAETVRRAHAVHPLAMVSTEYSLWSRGPEEELFETLRELGIGFVAYSPLGRGFLTGKIQSPEDFAEDDFRRFTPRFMGENFQKNLELIGRIEQMASEKGRSPAQLALAWTIAQGRASGVDVVPIAGTRSQERLEENVGALDVNLSDEELALIDESLPPGAASGERYPEAQMGFLGQ